MGLLVFLGGLLDAPKRILVGKIDRAIFRFSSGGSRRWGDDDPGFAVGTGQRLAWSAVAYIRVLHNGRRP